MPVYDLDSVFAPFCQRCVMGDEQHRGALFLVELRQQVEDRIRASAVEIARRLIGEEQRGVHRECPGQGDPLLLTPAQMICQMILPGGQPDPTNQRLRAFVHRRRWKSGGSQHGQHHIFECGKCVDQVVVLKDKTNFVSAQLGEGAIIQAGGFFTADFQSSGAWSVEQSNDVQQSAFSRTRGAHHRTETTLWQAEINLMQHLGFDRRTNVVCLADTAQLDNGW